MAEFLAQTGYKNPEGPNGVFQHSHNTDLPLFPWLIQHPAMLTNFLRMLEGWRVGRLEWFDFCPVDEVILNGAKEQSEDSALLVDIGGGHGYDIQNFRRRFPHAPGHLVLQDLPPVIDDIKELDPEIFRMKYDFLTPHPFKGEYAIIQSDLSQR